MELIPRLPLSLVLRWTEALLHKMISEAYLIQIGGLLIQINTLLCTSSMGLIQTYKIVVPILQAPTHFILETAPMRSAWDGAGKDSGSFQAFDLLSLLPPFHPDLHLLPLVHMQQILATNSVNIFDGGAALPAQVVLCQTFAQKLFSLRTLPCLVKYQALTFMKLWRLALSPQKSQKMQGTLKMFMTSNTQRKTFRKVLFFGMQGQ